VESKSGKIFGGYTDIEWKSKNGWTGKYGNSFIFSIREDFNIVILRNKDREREVNHDEDKLCSFGGNCGFLIRNDQKKENKVKGISDLCSKFY